MIENTIEIDEAEPVHLEQHLLHHIKRVIEALLFSSPEPLSLAKIREVTDTVCHLKPRQIRQMIEELRQDYMTTQRAFTIDEIGQGYLLRSHQEYASYIDQLYRNKRQEKLSPASLEVLSIIAFRQPITRPQIDAIRGVDSSGTLSQLLERNLVEMTGRLEVPGRPILYAVTKDFLTYFGLKDISELGNTHQQA